ncbi:AEC family transporter [Irregularibacter muris]|uniref:AEC family transporter n=1 Tax=Irregularibacter muris TaxID=1796619 RepID=A0AAE3HCA0_9FIRM|nr:AEC family transporter [Irregularibacter muris]MCR1897537.1 AEC family transporter [Irregularibacter muris]
MLTIIKSILSLFLVIVVGVYGEKKGIITNRLNRGLTDLLLQIILPFMIVSSFSFSYTNTIKSNVIKTFYYSFFAYIIVTVFSYLLTWPIKKEKKIILHFANVFTNTGYIGFPILHALYGVEAVIYGSIFNMFFVLFVWTYGIMLFNKKMKKEEFKEELKKTFLNPSIIAVYLGIILMVFDIQLPMVIKESMTSIGNMTAPLSMIIVGVTFSQVNIKAHLRDWTIYYGVVSKIILIPAILYFISIFINDRSIVSNTVIILASMPSATMTSIFAENFDIKKDYAAVMVVATTFLSLFTLPFLLKIII